jgi:hypothetical protein
MAANSAITASLTTAVVDAGRRDVRDARADGIFRWIVAAAGMLVLAALVGTGAQHRQLAASSVAPSCSGLIARPRSKPS